MKNQQDGFTIVELLVSIAVAGIVTASLSQVVTSFIHVSERGRYLSQANAYIEAKAESLRNAGYNSLNTGTTNLTGELPSRLPPSRNASMTVTNPGGGIKKVDFTISYKDQGLTNTYSYTTYIGELGVGQ